jgi:hypothetical protein
MNFRTILILFSLSIICCKNIDQGTKNVKIIEEFDIKGFEENKNESEYYSFIDESGYEIVQYKISDGYVELKKKPNDLFEEYRSFYTNGNLKEKKQCFINNGFSKGMGYKYDITGNIIKEENYDLYYNYSWEDLYTRLKILDIDFFDKQTKVQRYYDEKYGCYCWSIIWLNNIIIISGKDGMLLKAIIE